MSYVEKLEKEKAREIQQTDHSYKEDSKIEQDLYKIGDALYSLTSKVVRDSKTKDWIKQIGSDTKWGKITNYNGKTLETCKYINKENLHKGVVQISRIKILVFLDHLLPL